MVRGREVNQLVVGKALPTELKTGRYKVVVHSTEFAVTPEGAEEFRKKYKAEWEAYEGVTVESVDIVHFTKDEKVDPKYIWYDPDLGVTDVVAGAHTNIVVVFKVSSPLTILIVVGLIAVIFIAGLLVGLLISGALEPVFKFLYEHPEIVLAGLAVLALLALFLLGVRIPKLKKET